MSRRNRFFNTAILTLLATLTFLLLGAFAAGAQATPQAPAMTIDTFIIQDTQTTFHYEGSDIPPPPDVYTVEGYWYVTSPVSYPSCLSAVIRRCTAIPRGIILDNTTRAFTLTGLDAGSHYYMTVYAVTAGGTPYVPTTIEWDSPTYNPSLNVYVSSVQNTGAVFGWNAPSSATWGYWDIYICDPNLACLNYLYPRSQVTATVTELQQGTVYTVHWTIIDTDNKTYENEGNFIVTTTGTNVGGLVDYTISQLDPVFNQAVANSIFQTTSMFYYTAYSLQAPFIAVIQMIIFFLLCTSVLVVLRLVARGR